MDAVIRPFAGLPDDISDNRTFGVVEMDDEQNTHVIVTNLGEVDRRFALEFATSAEDALARLAERAESYELQGAEIWIEAIR